MLHVTSEAFPHDAVALHLPGDAEMKLEGAVMGHNKNIV